MVAPSKQGFTLVELLLSLGVVAIALVSLFTLLPGISQFSREQRDRERMQIFATDVFQTAEQALRSGSGVEDTDPESLWQMRTGLGRERLRVNAEETAWPSQTGAEQLVPVVWYRFLLETTSVEQVTLRMELRTEMQAEIHRMETTVPLHQEAW